jgi:peptidoglycan/LPS O-acetylase OafA/YrhL
MVLIDHFLWSNNVTGSRILDVFTAIRGSMWVGVNLFFALSGFLITGILWDTLHKPHFFRNFYSRRILRIFPLYYGCLFLLLALTIPLHLHWNGEQYYFLTYTWNIALWQPLGVDLGRFNIYHFWSLQVEEQFYLVWPFVIYRLRNRRRIVLVSAVVWVVVLCFRILLRTVLYHRFPNPYLIYSPTFSCADDLIVGCILALVLRSSARARILAGSKTVFIVCLALLVAWGIYDGSFDFMRSSVVATVGVSLVGIASAALIAMSLVPGGRTQIFFSNPLLRRFGKYSYGIYVYHYSIAGFFSASIRSFLNAHLHSRSIAVVGDGLVLTGMTCVVAVLSYHLFEVHFLRLKRFFEYRQHPNTA